MGIIRTVETEVTCDICGKWIIRWRSVTGGVSKEWAKYHAREKGASATDKRVMCKECRIKERIRRCSLIKKMGSAGIDNGKCLGFGKSEYDDEPCERCKRCIANTTYEI